MSFKKEIKQILQTTQVNFNLSLPGLLERAIKREEGILTDKGSLRVTTGKYTGRSPNDKFFVQDEVTNELINWGKINNPLSAENFQKLFSDLTAYLKDKELFVFDGFGGADPRHRLNLRFINEQAWQNIFSRHLFIRPIEAELQNFAPDYHIIAAPGFKADPAKHGTNSEVAVALNIKEKLILIAGTSYAGEIKKSVFTLMNYLLPLQNILSMHCSANVDANGNAALFFGLSGTGKTTLSTDPARRLVGDDQHGWSEEGIFNIEGGCYAKCIGLNREHEPQIYDALRFGAVLENVIMEETTRQVDFANNAITENTRAAYPMEYIPNSLMPSITGHPNVIFFLTADAFGVLPPVAILNRNQAMYHFLSGYTSKLAGTERGIKEPQATFSACFGAPFLPLSPVKYAQLLGDKMSKHGTHVYLINTGWTGGPYGVGQRFKIPYTRAIINAALEGILEKLPSRIDPLFGFRIPLSCPHVPQEIFTPEKTWPNPEKYQEQAEKLALGFKQNFAQFTDIPEEIKQASPQL
ncbi:MAG: phosphoenolpyruvate carboxykinase (ATP) [Clostridia bacterium]|nr:phosphoenolpyruvate carboxykinase (ATP) [Clostridia bacterium]